MLQRYKSHKIIEAGKIQGLRITHGIARPVVTAVVVGGREYPVPENFNARGTPEVGDYFVRYEDGYLSFSPAKAFEDGYDLLLEDYVQDSAVAHKESVVEPKSGDVTIQIEPAKMGTKPSM